MQSSDLNGSHYSEQEAPLHQSQQKKEEPESGLQGCEPADRCCICMPIKCGMYVLSVLTVATVLIYIIFIQYYHFASAEYGVML